MNINKLGEEIEKDRQLKISDNSDELYDKMKGQQANQTDLYWYKKYNELKKEHHQLQTDYNAKTIDCNDLSSIVREQAEALEQFKAHLRNSEELRELEIKQKKELKNKWLKSRAEVEELKQQLKAK